jgi:argininosuccinate lyase
MLKGLPLAYNKDMQEDKESVFDGVETVQKCLDIFAPMLSTMKVKKDNMRAAAGKGFINATDLADYLTKKGMPFRSAYKIVGGIVASCIASGDILETLPMETYKSFSELFEEDLYHEISLDTCVKKRISKGSTGPESVDYQLSLVAAYLGIK